MKTAFIRLHIAVILAGFTGVLGRLITLNESLIVFYRLLLSALALWLIAAFRKTIQKISISQLAAIAGVGFIAAIHWVTFYGAIKYSNVSVTLVCFSAIGFFTALVEPLLLRKKPVWQEIALGLMVILGIVIIFQFDTRYQTGIVIGVISAFLGAIFPVLNRILLKKVSVETLVTYELTGGFLTLTCILPVYLSFSPTTELLPTWSDWGWLLILSLFCTVWAFFLSAYALKYISAFTVNLTYNLEPVYGILLAFFLFQENDALGFHFYIGLSIIVTAVLLQLFRVWKAHR